MMNKYSEREKQIVIAESNNKPTNHPVYRDEQNRVADIRRGF